MATTRTNGKQKSADESLKELKKDFERRIRDMQAEVVSGEGTQAVEESLEFLRNELEQGLSDLRKQIDESVEPAREGIREKPFTSMGTAVGAGVLVGVVLGILLGRKSKE